MSTLLRIVAAIIVALLLGAAVMALLAIFLPVMGFHSLGIGVPTVRWVEAPVGVPRVALQLIPLILTLMPVALVILLFLIVLPRGNRARLCGRNDGLTEEDLRAIQKLHRGFEGLAGRIESLETILLSESRKG